MPQTENAELLNLIVLTLAQRPEGFTFTEIRAALRPRPSNGVLANCFKILVNTGHVIRIEGEGELRFKLAAAQSVAGDTTLPSISTTPRPASAHEKSADSRPGSATSPGRADGPSDAPAEGLSFERSERAAEGVSDGLSHGRSERGSDAVSECSSLEQSEGPSQGKSGGPAGGKTEGAAHFVGPKAEGPSEGASEGQSQGLSEGSSLTRSEGPSFERSLEQSEGPSPGMSHGKSGGTAGGKTEGAAHFGGPKAEGPSGGAAEGRSQGTSEGASLGQSEGMSLGRSEGRSEASSLTPSPVHPRDALVQQIFDRAISGIVLARMTRADASALFQTYVDQGVPPSDRVVCTYHLAAKLDQFRAADGSRYGLTPVHVDAWRQVYDRPPEPAPRHGGLPPTAARPPAGAASTPTSAVRRPPSGTGSAPDDTAEIGPDDESATSTPPSAFGRRSSGSKPSSAVDPLPSGSAEAAVGALAEVLQWVFGPRPKSGEPVRNRRRNLPLGAAAVTIAGLFVARIGHVPMNSWTLTGAAIAGVVVAALFLWQTRPEPSSGVSDPTSGSTSSPSRRRTFFRIAGAAFAAAAVIAAFMAYRQYRQRPPISLVQGFVTSRLAPLPARVAALDVTFAAPGNVGVRLTYRAEIENTAPLYRTEATTGYLENLPGHVLAALTSVDMTLDGVGGDKVRAAVGPAPTPDPRTVILLKQAVPIGTPAVASGTLFAWRTDNGWRFTIEQETPPRFAGEPRPSEKPSYILDAPADTAALADLLQRHLAYAAKVKEASVAEMAARSARSDVRSSSAGPTEDRGQRTAQPGRQTTDGGWQPGQVATGVSPADQPNPVSHKEAQKPQEDRSPEDTPGRALDSAPRLDAGLASTKPVGSNLKPGNLKPETAPIAPLASGSSTPLSAVSPLPSGPVSHVSELPRAAGAYYLKDGTWTALPHNHGHTVKNTGLNSALATLKAAEDKLAGQGGDEIPASSVLATIIYDGTDQIPTVSGAGLMIAYVGTLKPMPDAILKNYPLLRDYPLMEMARTTTVDGHEEARLIRIAPGIAAFGPTRIPATVESYGPLTLLRPTAPLAPGTYALTCGVDKYELRVKE